MLNTMKHAHIKCYFLLFCVGLAGLNSQQQQQQPIVLSNIEGGVVPRSQRLNVLSVADQLIGDNQDFFLSTLDDVRSPLGVELVVEVASEVKEEVKRGTIYDDASVLKVIASNFSKQVRGTLGRGENNFIQLAGGRLMKGGSSFPARIPQASDKTYTVEIVEVTSEGYTLSLGAASETLRYTEASNNGINVISRDP